MSLRNLSSDLFFVILSVLILLNLCLGLLPWKEQISVAQMSGPRSWRLQLQAVQLLPLIKEISISDCCMTNPLEWLPLVSITTSVSIWLTGHGDVCQLFLWRAGWLKHDILKLLLIISMLLAVGLSKFFE